MNGAKINSYGLLLRGFNIVAVGFFTAIGRPNESVLISFLRGFGFIIIVILLLPRLIGINGVWLTVPIAEFLTAIVGAFLVVKVAKKMSPSTEKMEI